MLKEIEPLQGKPWHEQIGMLVHTARRIAREYQSPSVNDAKGTLDCYLLEDKFLECRKILERYKKKEK